MSLYIKSMPREVNYLTHSSAGILSKKFVNQVNQEYPKGYGDSSTIPANSDGRAVCKVAHTL